MRPASAAMATACQLLCHSLIGLSHGVPPWPLHKATCTSPPALSTSTQLYKTKSHSECLSVHGARSSHAASQRGNVKYSQRLRNRTAQQAIQNKGSQKEKRKRGITWERIWPGEYGSSWRRFSAHSEENWKWCGRRHAAERPHAHLGMCSPPQKALYSLNTQAHICMQSSVYWGCLIATDSGKHTSVEARMQILQLITFHKRKYDCHCNKDKTSLLVYQYELCWTVTGGSTSITSLSNWLFPCKNRKGQESVFFFVPYNYKLETANVPSSHVSESKNIFQQPYLHKGAIDYFNFFIIYGRYVKCDKKKRTNTVWEEWPVLCILGWRLSL